MDTWREFTMQGAAPRKEHDQFTHVGYLLKDSLRRRRELAGMAEAVYVVSLSIQRRPAWALQQLGRIEERFRRL